MTVPDMIVTVIHRYVLLKTERRGAPPGAGGGRSTPLIVSDCCNAPPSWCHSGGVGAKAASRVDALAPRCSREVAAEYAEVVALQSPTATTTVIRVQRPVRPAPG